MSVAAPSETASVAQSHQSTSSQVALKLETNKVKTDLKKLLTSVDQGKESPPTYFVDKSGKLKTDVFFQMLSLHKIELEPKDKQYLTKLFQNGDKIKYKEAIQPLQIDLASASVDLKRWVVLRPEDQAQKAQDDQKSRVTAKALSTLGKEDVKSTTKSVVLSQAAQSVAKSAAVSKVSVTSSQALRKETFLKQAFPVKHQLDFPDYSS